MPTESPSAAGATISVVPDAAPGSVGVGAPHRLQSAWNARAAAAGPPRLRDALEISFEEDP